MNSFDESSDPMKTGRSLTALALMFCLLMLISSVESLNTVEACVIPKKFNLLLKMITLKLQTFI